MKKIWGSDFQDAKERLDCKDYHNYHKSLLIEELTREIKALQQKAKHFNQSLRIAVKASRWL